MTKICIVCKKELTDSEAKKGKQVQDDYVIRTIRKIKKMLGIASNNELYVCKNDVANHKKRRGSFEKSLVLTVVLAILIFFGLSILPILSYGTINIGSMAVGLVIAILLVLLAGFLKYVPSLKV